MREGLTSPPKVLLTGRPGIGKTTVIMRFLEAASSRTCRGFYTQEWREGGRRVGFWAITLAGERTVLAHVDFPRRHAVGKYGVDVAAFEALVLPQLEAPDEPVDLLVLDEIGKMECLSARFREAVWRALGGAVPVLGTIPQRGGGRFVEQVRARPDVTLVPVTSANRDDLPRQLAKQFAAWWARLPADTEGGKR
ncbi:MAG: AAA family ATPase [Anaerolineae bacterium]|nr:AAA family ATPase [Anaerolineae bacterium]